MRDLRFRLWDKEKKCFTYVGLRNKLPINYYDFYEVQQFTGLFDKQGKEIYEGDIVEIEGIRSFVVYWETSAGFRFNSYMPLGYIDRLYDASKVGEVVGNIYENKDLL